VAIRNLRWLSIGVVVVLASTIIVLGVWTHSMDAAPAPSPLIAVPQPVENFEIALKLPELAGDYSVRHHPAGGDSLHLDKAGTFEYSLSGCLGEYERCRGTAKLCS